MTSAEKLNRLKALLGDDATRHTDAELNSYLDFAGEEILNQLYAVSSRPDGALVPTLCEGIQVMSALAGINSQGAENESTHNENGINRSFRYSDMLQYIKNNVIPYAGVAR